MYRQRNRQIKHQKNSEELSGNSNRSTTQLNQCLMINNSAQNQNNNCVIDLTHYNFNNNLLKIDIHSKTFPSIEKIPKDSNTISNNVNNNIKAYPTMKSISKNLFYSTI